jgi:hypothetical protein
MVFVEIKNVEIAKLIISMIRFIQDHSAVVDGNGILKSFVK